MTGEMMGEMTGDPVGLVHAIRAGDSVLAPPDLKRGTVLNTQIVRIDRECHIRIQMSTLMNNTRHIPRGVTSGRRPRRSSMSGCLIFTGENALSHTHPDVNKQGTDTFGGGQIWLERTSCVPRATSQIIMAHLAGESAVRDSLGLREQSGGLCRSWAPFSGGVSVAAADRSDSPDAGRCSGLQGLRRRRTLRLSARPSAWQFLTVAGACADTLCRKSSVVSMRSVSVIVLML